MKRTLVLFALAVMGACAETRSAGRSAAQVAWCNPCAMPCVPGCAPEQVAAAPAPKPEPPAPMPAPAEPAAAATFTPPAGEYAGPQSVALSSATPGAVIRYTTDGSTPAADSPAYSGPIPVERTTTIRAITIAPGAPSSSVSTGAYTIAPPPPARVEVTKERLQLADRVLFDTGKATIDQRSYSLLDEVAAALRDHPEVKSVKIEGHTDARGGAAKNMKLSQARAEAVRRYLVDRGIADDRLQARGYGEERPIADNGTAPGREANRRVEFVIAQE